MVLNAVEKFWGPIYKISYNLLSDYLMFVVRSTYDSDLQRSKISLRNIVSQFTNDLTILQVNCSQENPCVVRKLFGKLDVRRKSIVALALSEDRCKVFCNFGCRKVID